MIFDRVRICFYPGVYFERRAVATNSQLQSISRDGRSGSDHLTTGIDRTWLFHKLSHEANSAYLVLNSLPLRSSGKMSDRRLHLAVLQPGTVGKIKRI